VNNPDRCGDNASRARYVRGCKCVDCRKENARYAKRNAILGTDLTDAGRVREHLAMLQESGMGRRRIATLSGVSDTVVGRLLGMDRSKPATRVHPNTAAKLFALRPGQVSDSVKVPIDGTRIRLRALVAHGWPQAALARRLGVSPANFPPLVSDGTAQVTARRARQVHALYNELVTIPGSSQRAINDARRKGWPRPIDLDDDNIDTPGYEPVRWERSTQDTAQVRREEIRDLMEMGVPIAQIADRLHITERSIYRHIRQDAA